MYKKDFILILTSEYYTFFEKDKEIKTHIIRIATNK